MEVILPSALCPLPSALLHSWSVSFQFVGFGWGEGVKPLRGGFCPHTPLHAIF
jgi:hypothetical protein